MVDEQETRFTLRTILSLRGSPIRIIRYLTKLLNSVVRPAAQEI
jgi:hypothetical protein